MFKDLKKKITLYATLSMFILMCILMITVNIVNYNSVVKDADRTLDVITQPNIPFFNEQFNPKDKEPKLDEFIPRDMSIEVPFESRFFSVTLDNNGNVVDVNTSRILSVDDEKLALYTTKAYKSKNNNGFIDEFRYLKQERKGATQITFLDCGRKLDSFKSFAFTSVGVGILGCIVVFIVFIFASGRIVYPIAESYEKQKRFISDASHELKTPLTIINANIDLLQGKKRKSEEINEIKIQTKLLTDLTNDLVYLSKMDESNNSFIKSEFSLSELFNETVLSFNTLALTQNKTIESIIDDNVIIHGSYDLFRQLISILIDNAIKYSSNKTLILVSLKKQKKNVVINISNSTNNAISKEDLDHIFDRFYRTDSSRNSETGGHGIGLSVAKAITENHNGKIKAFIDKDNRFNIEATFNN